MTNAHSTYFSTFILKILKPRYLLELTICYYFFLSRYRLLMTAAAACAPFYCVLYNLIVYT